jgi:hypothetical protein
MFGKKKYPIITSTFCDQIEDLRLAIEVLTGQRVRLLNIDFNTKHAEVVVERKLKNIWFDHCKQDSFWFQFQDLFYIAKFDYKSMATVRVIRNNDPDRKCWVGRSATSRWQEPLNSSDSCD